MCPRVQLLLPGSRDHRGGSTQGDPSGGMQTARQHQRPRDWAAAIFIPQTSDCCASQRSGERRRRRSPRHRSVKRAACSGCSGARVWAGRRKRAVETASASRGECLCPTVSGLLWQDTRDQATIRTEAYFSRPGSARPRCGLWGVLRERDETPPKIPHDPHACLHPCTGN